MANLVKEKNSAIIYAVRNTVLSLYNALKELSANQENDTELEEELKLIKKQEDSININNLEKMVDNNISNRESNGRKSKEYKNNQKVEIKRSSTHRKKAEKEQKDIDLEL